MEWAVLLKLFSLFVIYATCFLGALIPIKLTKWFSNQGSFLSYANCLGAGILLGASYCHLMSDAESAGDEGESVLGHTINHFLVGVGFLTSFALEKVLFDHPHEHPGGDHGHSHKHDKVVVVEDYGDEFVNSDTAVELSTIKQTHKDHHHKKEKKKEPEIEEGLLTEEHSDHHSSKEIDTSSSFEEFPAIHDHRIGHSDDHHHEHIVHHHHKRPKIPYMLFAVLALESAISGSALGIQQSFIKVFVTFIAIVTHIWAEAFTLCTSLLKAKLSDEKAMKSMAIFSGITPVAIVIGWLLSSVMSSGVVDIISSILISLAAGTFVYVGCMEIMAEEFANPSNRKEKLGLLLIGFGFMASLAFLFDQWE